MDCVPGSHGIYMARIYITWNKIKNAKNAVFQNSINNATPLIFFPAERLFKHNFSVISSGSSPSFLT